MEANSALGFPIAILAKAVFVSVIGCSALGPLTAAAQANSNGCPESLVRGLPAAPSRPLDGSEFARRVQHISGTERDAVTKQLILAGDIPDFLRHLRPISLQGQVSGGKVISITVCVTPDYLAVGSDKDFVRVPMGLRAAVAIADRFGFMLPTTRIVDAIYRQADIRLAPKPLQAGPEMRSTAYFVHHDELVHEEILAEGAELGSLIAGQKKDLVITNRLRTNPGRVAIYGWHQEDGKPIQSLSTFHGENYADYSHGVRLVSTVAYVNEETRSLVDVLQDPQLASLVSSEGPIANFGALIAGLDGDNTGPFAVKPAVNLPGVAPAVRKAGNRQ
jgi:hypothetical protein